MRILLVEDNELLGEAIRDYLKKSYFSSKLKYGRKIYKTYISPISFYNFFKSKLND